MATIIHTPTNLFASSMNESSQALDGEILPPVDNKSDFIKKLRDAFGFAKDSPPVLYVYPTLSRDVLKEAWEKTRPFHLCGKASIWGAFAGVYATVGSVLSSNYKLAAAGVAVAAGGALVSYLSSKQVEKVRTDLYARYERYNRGQRDFNIADTL